MKTLKYTIVVLFSFLLLSLKIGNNKGEYHIPNNAYSLLISDIDLDGDQDIISGHLYNSTTEWSGIAFMENDDFGYFYFNDSLFIYGGQIEIYASNIKGNEYPEIIGQYYDGQQSNIAIVEINNGNYNITNYPMCNHLSSFYPGDISGNGSTDFAFISNNDFLWGIIYNDGTGNFSAPEYFDLDYAPLDIACVDLNDDGRDDVIITDYIIEVYYSTENGFEQQLLGYAIPWSSSYKILPSDFDNDGDIDVIVTASSNSNHSNVYMFENLGNNQFYEHPYFEFSPFCSYAQTADFNNDSLPDMVFTGFDDEGLYIYNNIGNFQIEFDQFIQIDNDALLQKLTCADFDYNNYSDIALIKGYWGTAPSVLQIYFNNGIGGFQQNPVTKIIEKANDNNYFECFPNPMKYKTNFKINIKKTAQVELAIYNLQGKPVINLINNKLEGGIYNTKWDGVDNSNHTCNPGPYFAYLAVNGKIHQIIKLLII